VIGKLNTVLNARLRAANTLAALAKLGLDARMLSPQEFGAVLADELRLWRAVVQDNGCEAGINEQSMGAISPAL
jgi:tripartite-type tricarboxylate transporter receptor subunit TctC